MKRMRIYRSIFNIMKEIGMAWFITVSAILAICCLTDMGIKPENYVAVWLTLAVTTVIAFVMVIMGIDGEKWAVAEYKRLKRIKSRKRGN